jgi:hypothetical protein
MHENLKGMDQASYISTLHTKTMQYLDWGHNIFSKIYRKSTFKFLPRAVNIS